MAAAVPPRRYSVTWLTRLAGRCRQPRTAAAAGGGCGRRPAGDGRRVPAAKRPDAPPGGCQIPCRRRRCRDCVCKYSIRRGVAARACAGLRRFGRRNRRLVWDIQYSTTQVPGQVASVGGGGSCRGHVPGCQRRAAPSSPPPRPPHLALCNNARRLRPPRHQLAASEPAMRVAWHTGAPAAAPSPPPPPPPPAAVTGKGPHPGHATVGRARPSLAACPTT